MIFKVDFFSIAACTIQNHLHTDLTFELARYGSVPVFTGTQRSIIPVGPQFDHTMPNTLVA
jgi:hypothetical protein